MSLLYIFRLKILLILEILRNLSFEYPKNPKI